MFQNLCVAFEVLLRFQSPSLDISTLEMDDLVNCAVPSEDGTLLAVGCKKPGGGLSSGKVWLQGCSSKLAVPVLESEGV